MLKNPITLAGRGGVAQNMKLSPLHVTMKVTGGCSPASGYSVQFNLIGISSYYQLVFFVDSEKIGYGDGGAPAEIVNTGGNVNVYLEPMSKPLAPDIPTSVSSSDWNGGKVIIVFTFDGNETATVKMTDDSNNLLWGPITRNLSLGSPAMMRVEPVGVGSAARVNFLTAAFRLEAVTPDVLALLSGESPTEGADQTSGLPVLWLVGTAESSNLEMLEESRIEENDTVKSVVIDYLLAE